MNLDGLLQRIQVETGPLRALRRRAAATPRRILLPEAEDPRVRLAAAALVTNELAHPLLLGLPALRGADPFTGAVLGPEHWLDPTEEVRRREVAAHLWQRRRHRGMTQGQSHVLATEPLHMAATLLAMGEADALVAGATWATADVVRAALWSVGAAPEIQTVSGAFLMLPPRDATPAASLRGGGLMMADCAVVPTPDSDQLVQIARATVQSYRLLYARWPAVAFLSFSSHGSATHPAVRKVADAAAQLAAERPDLKVVGEVQVDAALVPEVARTKGIDWGESGTADVLVFPDLTAGNIGQKLVERLGGWRAVGPLLQGMRRPVCDLSRGCSALDVYDAVVLVTLTAG